MKRLRLAFVVAGAMALATAAQSDTTSSSTKRAGKPAQSPTARCADEHGAMGTCLGGGGFTNTDLPL